MSRDGTSAMKHFYEQCLTQRSHFMVFLFLLTCGGDCPWPHSDLLSTLILAETKKDRMQLALMLLHRQEQLNRLPIQLKFVY